MNSARFAAPAFRTAFWLQCSQQPGRELSPTACAAPCWVLVAQMGRGPVALQLPVGVGLDLELIIMPGIQALQAHHMEEGGDGRGRARPLCE